MITLPTKFEAENKLAENIPALLVKIQEERLEIEETSEVDWGNNSEEYNVDYTPPSPTSGDVQLNVSKIHQPLSNTTLILGQFVGGSPITPPSYGWQSFENRSVDGDLTLGEIHIRGLIAGGMGMGCELWSAGKGAIIGVGVVGVLVGDFVEFDFSSQGLTITKDTEYWLKFLPTGGGGTSISKIEYQNSNLYFDGQFDSTGASVGTDIGDADFHVIFTDGGPYQALGTIRTKNMDVGEIPTVNGEWVIFDVEPGGSLITYEAWASDTGAFAGEETSLGAIVDGDTITVLKRYYRVKASLVGNWDYVTDPQPTIFSIGADFSTYLTYIDNVGLPYESAINKVSSLATTIDTFKASTIGQVTINTAFCKSISSWLAIKNPKNKIVKIKAGYLGNGWTEDDYIDYFRGEVDDFTINSDDTISLILKDFSKEWSVDAPLKWEDASDDIIWTAQHPIDVMLDLFENYISIRESKIDKNSFNTVKEALTGWVVTRTITGDAEDAKKLIDELRVLTSTFFIPQADGRIKIKLWDATESAIDSVTDNNKMSLKYKGNLESIFNHSLIYYDHDGDGDNASDFGSLKEDIRTASKTDHDETSLKTIKDKWTASTETSQASTLAINILDRFEDPRSLLTCTLDRKYLYLETGDIINVTTKRAPSIDMNGITNVPYQIVRRDLDFTNNVVKLTLLEV